MVRVQLLQKLGIARLKTLRAKLQKFEGTKCVITPNETIARLCEQKHTSLLERMPGGTKREIERKWMPAVRRTVKAAVRLKDKKDIDRGRVENAWRRGAEIHLKAVWHAASRGAWGAPHVDTVRRKQRAISEYADAYGVRSGNWAEKMLDDRNLIKVIMGKGRRR